MDHSGNFDREWAQRGNKHSDQGGTRLEIVMGRSKRIEEPEGGHLQTDDDRFGSLLVLRGRRGRVPDPKTSQTHDARLSLALTDRFGLPKTPRTADLLLELDIVSG